MSSEMKHGIGDRLARLPLVPGSEKLRQHDKSRGAVEKENGREIMLELARELDERGSNGVALAERTANYYEYRGYREGLVRHTFPVSRPYALILKFDEEVNGRWSDTMVNVPEMGARVDFKQIKLMGTAKGDLIVSYAYGQSTSLDVSSNERSQIVGLNAYWESKYREHLDQGGKEIEEMTLAEKVRYAVFASNKSNNASNYLGPRNSWNGHNSLYHQIEMRVRGFVPNGDDGLKVIYPQVD